MGTLPMLHLIRHKMEKALDGFKIRYIDSHQRANDLKIREKSIDRVKRQELKMALKEKVRAEVERTTDEDRAKLLENLNRIEKELSVVYDLSNSNVIAIKKPLNGASKKPRYSKRFYENIPSSPMPTTIEGGDLYQNDRKYPLLKSTNV